MKLLLVLCSISCLLVGSLALAVPENYSGDGEASDAPIEATTEQVLSDENPTDVDPSPFALVDRQRRDMGILETIFKFFLNLLKETFGLLPPRLGSDTVNQLIEKAVPTKPAAPVEEGPKLPEDKPPVNESEAPIEVPTPYRAKGKPTAAYRAYMSGHRISLKGHKSYSIRNPESVRSSCNSYLRSTVYQETDTLRQAVMGRYCVKMIKQKH